MHIQIYIYISRNYFAKLPSTMHCNNHLLLFLAYFLITIICLIRSWLKMYGNEHFYFLRCAFPGFISPCITAFNSSVTKITACFYTPPINHMSSASQPAPPPPRLWLSASDDVITLPQDDVMRPCRLRCQHKAAVTSPDAVSQGHRHEVLFGGGGGFIGTQTHLPPKFSFSSDFGHFILKMTAKYVSRKKC